MESLKFSLENDGTEINNDVVLNHDAFPLSDLEYTIKFTPECTFWRLGIRLSVNEAIEFYHPEHRYKNPNPNFPDFHLAVGEWDNTSWSMPQRLQLAQYNFDNEKRILSRAENYVQNNEVIWTIRYDSQVKEFRISYASKGVAKVSSKIKSHADFAFFKLFAWADKTPFKIKGSISWEQKKIGSFNIKMTEHTLHETVDFGVHSHAGLLSDTESGKDLLDISKDVIAFSKIMAARDFIPPLAIALLGRWGSGKSFFMRELMRKINQISEEDEYNVYCKGIAQIRFNAWSYLDANLWASIISKIFEGLNEYISADSSAGQQKEKIKKELSQKLTVSKEKVGNLETQKDSLEVHITDLTSRRKFASDKLTAKISTLRKSNLHLTLKRIDELFKVRETITTALENNVTFKKSEIIIEEIIPEQYLNDPSLALTQLKSTNTFLKVFLSKDNWIKNLVWLIIFAVILIITPYLIAFFSSKAATLNFTIVPSLLVVLTGFKAVWNQAQLTYNKIQPIAASLWKIKEDYEKARQEAIFMFEQEEKALKIEIEKSGSQIIILDQQINQAKIEVAELDYKINNALASEALYSFIQAKSIGEDYKKHLGIISMIRKDLEILNNLFAQHKVEASENATSDQFKKYFNNPLERIILYIDDLDRCPAENVMQVLDAVNLLMAYPLFIVVVGVDFRWILDALKTKHSFKKSGISPESYLEKIFQIPFQLKGSTNPSVKKMLNDLMLPVVNSVDQIAQQKSNLEPQIASNENNIINVGDVLQDLSANNQVNLEKRPEEFIIPERERIQMQTFSGMLGNNPRTIKRFLNIYRVIRTHEDLIISKRKEEKGLLTIMFLIALSVGKNKYDYKLVVTMLTQLSNTNAFGRPAREISLKTIIDDPSKDQVTREFKDKLIEFIGDDADGKIIKLISLADVLTYAPLVNRFTYIEFS